MFAFLKLHVFFFAFKTVGDGRYYHIMMSPLIILVAFVHDHSQLFEFRSKKANHSASLPQCQKKEGSPLVTAAAAAELGFSKGEREVLVLDHVRDALAESSHKEHHEVDEQYGPEDWNVQEGEERAGEAQQHRLGGAIPSAEFGQLANEWPVPVRHQSNPRDRKSFHKGAYSSSERVGSSASALSTFSGSSRGLRKSTSRLSK